MQPDSTRGSRTLAVIAVFKFGKSMLLIALGITLLRLSHPQAAAHFRSWFGGFPLAAGHELIGHAIGRLLRLDNHTIALLGGVAFAYATLFAIEGVGLWRRARWAEWLTAIATALLVPIELHELLARFTPVRLLALLINVAIVLFLVWLLRAGRDREAPSRSADR